MIPDVLQKIAGSVEKRVRSRESLRSLAQLQNDVITSRNPHRFAEVFQDAKKTRILAEIKFKSPALGELKAASAKDAVAIARIYLDSGAVALSILTEEDHFAGNSEYLRAVRKAKPEARILMKDFIVSPYQIFEAREMGADCILLIVALLGELKTREFLGVAQSLGLSTLIEVHDEEELEIALKLDSELIGVNNRDLKTLQISLETSFRLAKYLPKNRVVLSESGIYTREEILKLQSVGYQGFLVGSALMQSGNAGETLKALCGAKP